MVPGSRSQPNGAQVWISGTNTGLLQWTVKAGGLYSSSTHVNTHTFIHLQNFCTLCSGISKIHSTSRASVSVCMCMHVYMCVCYTWTHGLQCDMTHSQCTAHVPLCRPRENQVKVCFLLFVLIKLHCQQTVSLTENSVTNMASAIDCSNAHRLLRVSKHYLTSATLSQMIDGKTDL